MWLEEDFQFQSIFSASNHDLKFKNAAFAVTRYYSSMDECSARNGTHRDRQEGRGEGSIRNVTGCPRGTPKHNFLALLRGSHDLPSTRDSDFVLLPRTPSCYHVDSSDCK